jgi:hypothetical protein
MKLLLIKPSSFRNEHVRSYQLAPGVNVVIKIFEDFSQFSAKKLKNMLYFQLKTAIFSLKYFKIIPLSPKLG